MKIAIFGGTFNPVHCGHLNFCRQCSDLYSFERVLLIPTNLPPHKVARHLASNADRMAMLRLAVQGEPKFEANDIEYRLGGKSYTVETLRALRRELPDGDFTLLVGSDMLRTFRQWYHYEEILEMANLLAGARFQQEREELLELRERFGALATKIEVASISVTEVSSTQVRENIRNGRGAGNLLPESVYNYIREHKLYE